MAPPEQPAKPIGDSVGHGEPTSSAWQRFQDTLDRPAVVVGLGTALAMTGLLGGLAIANQEADAYYVQQASGHEQVVTIPDQTTIVVPATTLPGAIITIPSPNSPSTVVTLPPQVIAPTPTFPAPAPTVAEAPQPPHSPLDVTPSQPSAPTFIDTVHAYPWQVAHQLQPGNEVNALRQALTTYNQETGSQAHLGAFRDTVVIYVDSHGHMVNWQQIHEINERLIREMLKQLTDGSEEKAG